MSTLRFSDAMSRLGELVKLIAEMEEEERRALREGLTEEELAIFDLLTKPEPKLTKARRPKLRRSRVTF